VADTALLAADGCFYAIEESQTKAYIADLETEHRATALGVYSGFNGRLYLPASLPAAGLWTLSPSAAFLLAATLSLVAILVLARGAACPANDGR